MIKSIETVWRGYRFRSRLEARWAVFFSALGIPWVYEPEGFVLSDGSWYLPDFWVPINPKWLFGKPEGSGYWVEIKPGRPTNAERKKCQLLAIESGHTVCLLSGQPWPGEVQWETFHRTGNNHHGGVTHDFPWLGYPAGSSEWNEGYDHTNAFRAARSARFDHGEIPA